VGTETWGSIISPAQANGIVGIKPSAGLIPTGGIIPISSTFDTAGPMARSVRDAAVLLGVLAGRDYAHELDGYMENNRGGLKNIRIGIYGNTDGDEPEFNARLEELVRILAQNGAEIVSGIPAVPSVKAWHITRHEFKRGMDYYLSTLRPDFPIKTLEDIVRFNRAHPDEALRYGQNIFEDCLADSTGRMIEPGYIDTLCKREAAIRAMNQIFEDYRVDVLLSAVENSEAAPLTGFPGATLPAGVRADGLPIGSYWMARRFDEAGLLRVMAMAEKLFPMRREPA
jgi:amidase